MELHEQLQHTSETLLGGKKTMRRKDVVRIGCGAGFAGDRPAAALRLLQKVPDMHYLVLECLAERTLAVRYQSMVAGGKGFDPRISEWMRLLLPTAVRNGVCLITNMGAVDVLGAQEEVMRVAAESGMSITVAVAYELLDYVAGNAVQDDSTISTQQFGGCSTYLGAAPIVHVLKTCKPDVIITSRMADAALFLAPMIYELGWSWQDWDYLAQGTVAGHLLECGCQLTGGYFMHPADPHRTFSAEQLADASLPFADVRWNGELKLGKAVNSGGELSLATCAQQLLYEITDPAAYITPDVVVNVSKVTFEVLSPDQVLVKNASPALLSAPSDLLRLVPQDCGWRGWGEISYAGASCVERASAADHLVHTWLEESYPGTSPCILSYEIGQNGLQVYPLHDEQVPEIVRPPPMEVRLRMDGLFEQRVHAIKFTEEFEALYTNGPAGGGGIRTGHSSEIQLHKFLVPRENVLWQTQVQYGNQHGEEKLQSSSPYWSDVNQMSLEEKAVVGLSSTSGMTTMQPAPAGVKLPLYLVAHGRTGDKGDLINMSIIPHCPSDLDRLCQIITPMWVQKVMEHLFPNHRRDSLHDLHHHETANINRLAVEKGWKPLKVEDGGKTPVDVYEVPGVKALNIVVRNVLDGGVTCSRRLDRHGKSLSDLFLSQFIILPP